MGVVRDLLHRDIEFEIEDLVFVYEVVHLLIHAPNDVVLGSVSITWNLKHGDLNVILKVPSNDYKNVLFGVLSDNLVNLRSTRRKNIGNFNSVIKPDAGILKIICRLYIVIEPGIIDLTIFNEPATLHNNKIMKYA